MCIFVVVIFAHLLSKICKSKNLTAQENQLLKVLEILMQLMTNPYMQLLKNSQTVIADSLPCELACHVLLFHSYGSTNIYII